MKKTNHSKWKKRESLHLKNEDVADLKVKKPDVCPIRKAFVEEIDAKIKSNYSSINDLFNNNFGSIGRFTK